MVSLQKLIQDLRRGLSLPGVRCVVIWTSEDLDSRVSFHAIVFAQVDFFRAVNLDQWDILLLQCCCSFFIFGGQCLAVAAPWCKELCEDEVVAFDEVGKGILLQVMYVRC